MNYKNISREIIKFSALLVLWTIIGLAVFGALFVGFAFCGGLVQGYLKLGKSADIYFLWFALLASALTMTVLLRWVVSHSRHKHNNDT